VTREYMNSTSDKDFGRLFLFGAFILLLYAAARMFAPFLAALLAAASMALLLEPLQRRLIARAPRHPAALAAALALLTVLVAVVPFLIGGWTILREAAEAYPAARYRLEAITEPGAPAWKPPAKLAPLIAAGRGYAAALKIQPRTIVLKNLDKVSGKAAGLAASVVKDFGIVLLNLAIFTAALFLFLRDGPRMARRGLEIIPLQADMKERLMTRAKDALLAVVSGIFAVALLQGMLAWAGLALFRVPFAGLLGLLVVLLSPIPFIGSAFVAGPVVIYLLLAGEAAKAAALAAWFGVVVGLSDNLLRPILLSSQMKIPIPVLFIGIIGALQVYGMAGLFIGPIVIALFIGLIDIFKEKGRANGGA